MSTGFTTIQNGIQENLDAMLKRSKSLRGYLNRVVYRQYQDAQLQRWMTEGASEGAKWKALSPSYAKYKTIRYGGGPRRRGGNWASYPGAGTKTLIATGTLVSGVIGPMQGSSSFGLRLGSENHRKVVTERSIEIHTTVSYAEKVNEIRQFVGLGRATSQKIAQGVMRYITKGEST